MKTLYEFTCNAIGVSYVRLYAWAESLNEARELARPKVEDYARSDLGTVPDIEDWRHSTLMTSESVPFATSVSSEGWEI